MIEYIEYREEFKNNVIEFWNEICVEEFGFHSWKNDIKNMDNDLYKEHGGNFWLAIDGDEIVGTISLENLDNNKGKLKSMYVSKKYRNKKIASKLMELLIDFAYKNGYKEIILDTYKEFQAAIKFYEKIGFVKILQDENKYIYKKQI